MIKEEVLSALRVLGFIPEEIESAGYKFDYEGLTLLYSVDDEEARSITFAVPGIFDLTDENRHEVLEAMIKLCNQLKFVQPNIMFDDQVWLTYQHFLGDNEPTAQIAEHMIRVLSAATVKFHQIVNNSENEN